MSFPGTSEWSTGNGLTYGLIIWNNQPSALEAHNGSFFLFSLFRADFHTGPTFDGLYLEWYPVWSDRASKSQQLLGLIELQQYSVVEYSPAGEELHDLTATSWLIKARKWSALNTWLASPLWADVCHERCPPCYCNLRNKEYGGNNRFLRLDLK